VITIGPREGPLDANIEQMGGGDPRPAEIAACVWFKFAVDHGAVVMRPIHDRETGVGQAAARSSG
jgi:hypothetical protein